MSSGSPLALYSENNKHGTGVMLSKTRTEPVIIKYKFWLTQFTTQYRNVPRKDLNSGTKALANIRAPCEDGVPFNCKKIILNIAMLI